jgi:D-alanyl-D-alanine endopeptidase (penicillin-binding protein 7)
MAMALFHIARTLIAIAAVSALAALPADAAPPRKATPAKKKVIKAKQRVARAPVVPDIGADGGPNLLSHAAVIIDQSTGELLYAKKPDSVAPIASITKLMTAIVVLTAQQPMDEAIVIADSDVDTLKNSRSRLNVGSAFYRSDLLRLALMASDNRAAAALGRSFPGGIAAFVARMNEEAARIGMEQTRFVDATGLSPQNVSSPQDLARLVGAAARHSLIREFSTTPALNVTFPDTGRTVGFINSNALVRGGDWNIDLSKTGFINESGKCLVMRAMVQNRPVIMVLLDSWGRYTRIGDANRIRRWLEAQRSVRVAG